MTVNHVQAHDTATNNKTGSSTSTNEISANQFMTLLVAEIHNQDPTQPMDPTTFMSQLVQLNELEQVMSINQVVQQYKNSSSTSGSTPDAN